MDEEKGFKDSFYTASSRASASHYPVEQIRLSAPRFWAPATSDASPWMQLDMQETYVIVGLHLLKKSPEKEHLDMYTMKSSLDGVTFSLVEQYTLVVYELNEYTTNWFEYPVSGRYWRLELYKSDPLQGVKAGYIGYV